jgi:uncharacterized membrane protein SpoIIM required for sporulation
MLANPDSKQPKNKEEKYVFIYFIILVLFFSIFYVVLNINPIDSDFESYKNHLFMTSEKLNLFKYIFINNLAVCLIALFGGALSYGIVSGLCLVYNAFFLACHVQQTSCIHEYQFGKMAYIFAHIPFEIGALVMCSGLSYEASVVIRKTLKSKEEIELGFLVKSNKLYVSFLFLLIAALLEIK